MTFRAPCILLGNPCTIRDAHEAQKLAFRVAGGGDSLYTIAVVFLPGMARRVMQHDETSFTGACGVDGPLTISVVGPSDQERRSVTLQQPFVVIGSDSRCDVVLEDDRVARRHLYLQVLGGRLLAVDLGTKGKSYLGLQPFQTTWVHQRDFIRVGPFHLRVEYPEVLYPIEFAYPPDLPFQDRLAEETMVPRLSADLYHNNKLRDCWRFNRCMAIIGRSGEARLKLVDNRISLFHACMIGLPGSVWIVDLVSRDGTFVNGQRVRCHMVRPRDQVDVGPYRLLWRQSSPNSLMTRLEVQSEVAPTPTTMPTRPTVMHAAPVTMAPSPLGVPTPTQLSGHPGSMATSFGPLSASGVPIPVHGTVPVGEAIAPLMPVLQHFGMMQQQMMDQFQQMIMMMMQTMQQIHHEQTDLLRKEMEHLRERKSGTPVANQSMPTSWWEKLGLVNLGCR
jgi:pSer/pThr/pTyr-binding forkhead associated (FHA) protein